MDTTRPAESLPGTPDGASDFPGRDLSAELDGMIARADALDRGLALSLLGRPDTARATVHDQRCAGRQSGLAPRASNRSSIRRSLCRRSSSSPAPRSTNLA